MTLARLGASALLLSLAPFAAAQVPVGTVLVAVDGAVAGTSDLQWIPGTGGTPIVLPFTRSNPLADVVAIEYDPVSATTLLVEKQSGMDIRVNMICMQPGAGGAPVIMSSSFEDLAGTSGFWLEDLDRGPQGCLLALLRGSNSAVRILRMNVGGTCGSTNLVWNDVPVPATLPAAATPTSITSDEDGVIYIGAGTGPFSGNFAAVYTTGLEGGAFGTFFSQVGTSGVALQPNGITIDSLGTLIAGGTRNIIPGPCCDMICGTTVLTVDPANPVIDVEHGNGFITWVAKENGLSFYVDLPGCAALATNLSLFSGPLPGVVAIANVDDDSNYGCPCRTSNDTVPTISASATTTAGTVWDVDLSGGIANAPALFYGGLSNTSWGGVPLPLDLTPFGGQGSFYLQSSNFEFSDSLDANGEWSLSLPMPPGLAGTTVYTQFFTTDPGASPAFAASSGFALTVN